jgi:hypothetical protein
MAAPLPVARFIKIGKRATGSGAFTSYINKTRSSSSHICALLVFIATFGQNATGSGALPFVYLKFYGSHSYF